MPRRPATDSDEVPLRELGAAGDLEAFVDALLALYDHRGRAHYDEIVTQREHALQAALQAAEAGHDDQLIAAALLHDVGHLLDSEAAHATKDLSHEGRGADLLQPVE